MRSSRWYALSAVQARHVEADLRIRSASLGEAARGMSEPRSSDELKAAVLDAALKRAPDEGFSDAMLGAARRRDGARTGGEKTWPDESARAHQHRGADTDRSASFKQGSCAPCGRV